MKRRLDPHEITRAGDYVTINDTVESGFRQLNGIIGYQAREYSYPIYRDVTFLVLGHGGHGKGTFCKLLEDAYGLRSMSSSQAALPFIWPSLQAAGHAWVGGDWYKSMEDAYDRRGDVRELWKALISLYNTPDKTTLSRQILSQVPVYDGMRCAEEFEASRGLFDYIFWVDRSRSKGPDPSMGIARTDDMIHIDNNGSLDDLLDQVEALGWLRNE